MKRLLLVLLMLGLFAVNGLGQQSQRTATGNITAAGTTCTSGVCVSSIANVGTSSASIKIKELPGTLTFSATINFEVSLEGTDWYAMAGSPVAGGASASSTTAAGAWRFTMGPFRWIRARCSAFTSGIIAVTIETSTAFANQAWDSTSGNFYVAGYLTGLANVVSKGSTPYTVETNSVNESRRTVFVCTVDCTLNLPAATVGKFIIFATDSTGANAITVVCSGSDVIIDTTGTAYVQADLAATAGTSLALLCVEASKWVVVGMTGSVTLT